MAEIKPFKFGEPLTGNADGNPELSLSNQESVETRRKVCIKCGNIITNKRKGLKFCSVRCRGAYASYKHCIKIGRFEKPGVGSGNNQYREKNPYWRGGKTLFRKIAFGNFNYECNRCGKITENLLVHHKDEDKLNNDLSNLEILCKACHQNHHCTRDSISGQYIKG